MEGIVNEITLSVAPNMDREKIMTQVRTILERNYIKRMTSKDDPVELQNRRIDIIQGIRTAYMTERKNLPVVQILRQDMESFATLAFLFPLLFLSMASLTIYVLLNRLVESQRIQIGLMRAMGYTEDCNVALSRFCPHGRNAGITNRCNSRSSDGQCLNRDVCYPAEHPHH